MRFQVTGQGAEGEVDRVFECADEEELRAIAAFEGIELATVERLPDVPSEPKPKRREAVWEAESSEPSESPRPAPADPLRDPSLPEKIAAALSRVTGAARLGGSSLDATTSSDSERVGFITRLIGGLLLIAGLVLIGFGFWGEFIAEVLKRRAFAFYGGIGGWLCYLGFYWVRGKRFFYARVDPDSNTPTAGRAGMFDGWPQTFQAIIDQLRPALLATGAAFYGGDQRERRDHPRVRIGWPGWWGSDYAVMAVVRPALSGGLELLLRVGTESGLISTEGPLQPVAQGKSSIAEYGSVTLKTPDVPPAVFELIALAGWFTRMKCKLGPPPRRTPRQAE